MALAPVRLMQTKPPPKCSHLRVTRHAVVALPGVQLLEQLLRGQRGHSVTCLETRRRSEATLRVEAAIASCDASGGGVVEGFEAQLLSRVEQLFDPLGAFVGVFGAECEVRQANPERPGGFKQEAGAFEFGNG